jgi:very-short-patch-repair endonuclease
MFKRKTDKQFKKEVFDLVRNEYTILSKYEGSRTKITIKHDKCGHIYEVTPHNFLQGSRCPRCFGKIKKTHEQFVKEVYDLVWNEYSVLEEYKSDKTKIKMKHNKCGNIYEITPNHFLRGNRCPKCYGNNRKTTEQFKKEVFNLVGDEYSVLEEYTNNQTKIKMKHNKCGHEWKVRPSDFLYSNSRCPKCYGTPRKTTKQFKQEVYDLTCGEYRLVSDYKTNKTKVKIEHTVCGLVYEVRPDSFRNGRRCPVCKSSKGEEKIAKYLLNKNIQFTSQKTFNDLVNIFQLRFDFYLPEYNMCIEYDGIQHFEPVRFNGISEEVANENFKNQQIRDKMKNKYCEKKGINLLRIKYTDFKNIEKILKKEIGK